MNAYQESTSFTTDVRPRAAAAAVHTHMQLEAKHARLNARLLFLHDRMRKFSLCHREDADFQFVVVCACESEGFISNVSSSLGAHMILLLHTCVVCMCLSLSHALISTCMLPDACV